MVVPLCRMVFLVLLDPVSGSTGEESSLGLFYGISDSRSVIITVIQTMCNNSN